MVRDAQDFRSGRHGETVRRLTLGTFLYCDDAGGILLASAMAGPGADVDARLADVVLAGRDPAGRDGLSYFVSGGANGRTPGLGVDVPRDVDRATRAMVVAMVDAAVAASGLPAHVRRGFALLRRYRTDLARMAAGPLLHPGMDDARDLASANPTGFLLALSLPDAEEIHDDPAGWRDHGFPRALLRRMAGIDPSRIPEDTTRDGLRAMALLALSVPVDWFPADGSDGNLRAFSEAAMACHVAAASGPAPATLARSSGGDWAEFNARCLSALRHHRGWSGDRDAPGHDDLVRMVSWTLNDVPVPLASSVLLPLALRSGASPDRDDPLVDLLPVAVDLVYGDKSLPACIETSGRWHRHEHALNAAMPSDHDDKAWDALHPPTRIGNYDIVPLVSSLDLMAEGSPGPDAVGVPGLDHCVGGVGYRIRGYTRASHFVSVRTGDVAAPYARVATAELSFAGGRLTVGQVQGRGNVDPPKEVSKALAVYVSLPVAPVPVLALRDDPDALRARVGYDPTDESLIERALRAWEPYLPRDMRGLTLDGFSACIGLGPTHPAP